MVYGFRTGSYKGLDAQETGNELERIRQANGGRLATQMVWKEAKKKSSPIHNAFTWDVEKAAAEFWAHEARLLIRTVIQVEGEVERAAFVNVSVQSTQPEDEGKERYYQSVSVLASSPLEYQSALALGRARLASAQNTLQELIGLASRKEKPKLRRAQKHVASASAELAV